MSDANPPNMSRRHDSPDEAITAHPGASVNRIVIRLDANALSIIALMLSVAAIVIVISQAITQPQTVDAKIETGAAKISESMSERLADVKATAQAGKEHARIALDEVQRANAQLEAKGLIRGSH